MVFQLPDPSTPFGERVARRLRDERLIWLTTVDAKGMPQPTPVWFLWDAATSTILIYSRADANRLAHLQQQRQSEMMSEEEKLVAQEHLKRFAHLIKHDPYEE
jgi:PPOX class probable F420-dependent enzyme